MCDFCESETIVGEGGYGRIVEDPKDSTRVIKCQNCRTDAPFRELYLYFNLDHPNIPKIQNVEFYDHGNGHDKIYVHFNMKRYQPLIQLLEEDDLTMEMKRKVFLDMVDVVAYLQSRGVYHQDIRVDNVVVDMDQTKAYLIDYGLTCDTYIANASWTDPNITEKCYNCDDPSQDTLMKGDNWSLGLLGIHLFTGENIYKWASDTGCQGMDHVYLLKGRFGAGLEMAHLDLESIPSDMLTIIRALLDRVSITNGYFDDPLDYENFNQMKNQQNYVMKLYNVLLIKINGVEQFIANMKTKPTKTHAQIIALTKETLNKVEATPNKSEKIKYVYFLYDYILPKSYDVLKSSTRYWQTCVNKLKEFEAVEPDLRDLVDRRLGELEAVLEKSRKFNFLETIETTKKPEEKLSPVKLSDLNNFPSLKGTFDFGPAGE